MAEAIRLVSIGRGIDPRGYVLIPLGGAGPIDGRTKKLIGCFALLAVLSGAFYFLS